MEYTLYKEKCKKSNYREVWLSQEVKRREYGEQKVEAFGKS